MYRIIIADDEAIECRALELMIQREFPELEVLPSVYNGADLIAAVQEFEPDIAIVDINMPKMNGLDALELIRTRNSRLKIIISSAYSEFEYAKKAMKLNVSDYIVKPLEKESFVETLGKVLAALQGEQKLVYEQESKERYLDEINSVVGREFLSSLLLGEPDEKSFQIYQQSLHRSFRGGVLMAVRLLSDADLWRNPIDYSALMKLLEEEIGKYCCCVGKLYKEELYFLIFPEEFVAEQNHVKWLSDIAAILLSLVKKQEGHEMVLGVSTWKYDYEEMGTGLAECRIAARSSTKAGVFFYKDSEKRQETGTSARELGQQYLESLKKGGIERCKEEIRALFSEAVITEENANLWQLRILGFMQPICDYMEESQGYLRRYSRKGKLDFPALCGCADKDSMQEWVMEVLERLSERGATEGKSREYIERAILHMERHYREDVSMEETAEAAGISTFYLSRLLKQELSQTFVEILTDIRMKKALGLLWKGNYTVREIAEQSGYGNITYFYKVFKKYTGRNIGEIREYLS